VADDSDWRFANPRRRARKLDIPVLESQVAIDIADCADFRQRTSSSALNF
jgi:hypothetical protein